MTARRRWVAAVALIALVGISVFLWRHFEQEAQPVPGRYTLSWGPNQRRWVMDTATGEMWHECGYDDTEGTRWCAESSAREAHEMALSLARYRSEKADREVYEQAAREMLDAGAGKSAP